MSEKIELTEFQEEELTRIIVFGFGYNLLTEDQLVRKGMINSVPNPYPDPGLMFYVAYHYVLTDVGKDYLTEVLVNELNQTNLPLATKQSEMTLFKALVNGEISDEEAFNFILAEHNHSKQNVKEIKPVQIGNKRLALAQMQGRFEEMVG